MGDHRAFGAGREVGLQILPQVSLGDHLRQRTEGEASRTFHDGRSGEVVRSLECKPIPSVLVDRPHLFASFNGCTTVGSEIEQSLPVATLTDPVDLT
jgi:hypothetical protein